MAVKISKLWSNKSFLKLTNDSKLFYIYLATAPNISSVGVVSLSVEGMAIVKIQTGLSIETIRKSSEELVDAELIHIKRYDEDLYFVVKAHFDSIPKSDTSVLKVTKDLELLPKGLVKYLDTIGINVSRKAVVFQEPTEQEVMDYALSQGYKIDAAAVIAFYRGKAVAYGKEGLWLDSRGKQVKDWKAKLRVVWFKDENKLKTVDGAPKGFESFYINFEGNQVFPESWKDGKPHSKNIAIKKALQAEYEKRKGNS
jgi:hypothetical protein